MRTHFTVSGAKWTAEDQEKFDSILIGVGYDNIQIQLEYGITPAELSDEIENYNSAVDRFNDEYCRDGHIEDRFCV